MAAADSARARRHPLLDALERDILLADGAGGTLMRSRGWRGGLLLAALDNPDLVRSVHEAYIRAGARLILTSTFDANRTQLARLDRADRVRDANFFSAKLARDAREISGEDLFIGGSIGPLGRDQAIGAIGDAEARDIFAEQVGALVEGGVDLLVLETFPSAREATLATEAIRSVTDLPVVAMLNFGSDLRTPAGEALTEVLPQVTQAGADVFGVNCGVGPQAALDILQQLAPVRGETHLAVKPNAGLPRIVGGEPRYPSGPAYFADFALRAKDLGASIIGGCCGTTPEHTAEMRSALQSVTEEGSRVQVPLGGPQFDPPPLEEPLNPTEPSLLRDKLAAGRYAISVEIDPPRGVNARKAIEGAATLREAGADAINIGDSPMARVRMSALALAIQIEQQVGIETIIHQTTRDRNLMALQADLLGAHALGVRNLIALTGDPPPPASQSSAVWDVDSIGFIRVLRRLNEGVDFAGNSLGRPTDFFIAGAANPTADDLDLELRRVREKVDAGAHLLMTQPAYDIETVVEFFERLGPIDIPVLLGVLPLMSSRHTEFIHNELAGVVVPDAVRRRMREAGEAGAEAGIEIALEHVQEARDRGFRAGIYVMPSFGRYEVAREVVQAAAALAQP